MPSAPGARRPAPRPVDRRKTGSKHHVISDGGGIPFHVITTAADVNDVTQTLALVDGLPPVAGRVGHPRKRSDALLGDKGYDSNPNRRELRRRRVLPVISRKGAPDIVGLGRLRYVVEQTFVQLHRFKRLAVRLERRLDLHNAFVSLACATDLPATTRQPTLMIVLRALTWRVTFGADRPPISRSWCHGPRRMFPSRAVTLLHHREGIHDRDDRPHAGGLRAVLPLRNELRRRGGPQRP
ncbi:transposase [Kitasatospora purpeofusca]|uniref:transposase n=1 Tax=Kitasatospora purpeofusca TaxID=67352 RepID=UPI0035DF0C5C